MLDNVLYALGKALHSQIRTAWFLAIQVDTITDYIMPVSGGWSIEIIGNSGL